MRNEDDNVRFENSDIDPGFTPKVPEKECADQESVDNTKQRINKKDDQQQPEPEKGLEELDGTNPGSNAHPMDDDAL